jgi:hypothetical protein
MADNGLSIDQNPGRWLVLAAGGILCEAGVQAMLTSQTISAFTAIWVTGIGVLLILVAVFWKKFGLQKTVFFGRLNQLASHPALWITLAMVVWITTQLITALREIRMNNAIIALRNDEQSMARVIDRGVMPRHLDRNQQARIAGFLLQFPSQKFSFELPNDQESVEYAVDIRQALEKGGWTIDSQHIFDFKNDIQHEGVTAILRQTEEHAKDSHYSAGQSPGQLLQMAFGLALVAIDRGGGGVGDPSLTEDRVVLSIGKRIMNTKALEPPHNPAPGSPLAEF